MIVLKRLQSWVVLLTIALASLAIACTSQPTATSAPPATATTAAVAPPATAAPTAMAPEPTAMAPEPTAMPDTMMPDVPAEALAIYETAPANLLTLVLNEDNDSGQTGWANLTAKGDQTEVILLLSPGDLETESAHIHSGRCGDALGGVAHPLTSFVDGAGFSITTLEVEMASLLNGDFAINTHKKGEGSVYTNCGNIPADAESVTIALGAQNDSGQSGLATLTARGTTTEIVAFLSPGALESQLMHIHSGQCGADTLGGVVHPLTSFIGGFGPSVTTVNAPLNSVRTGDFAINIHQAGKPSVYTACGNIGRNTATITLDLSEDNSSGQSGFALLTPRGDNTEVWLSLSKGSMISSAVHIHSGQCGDSLGDVVHGLTNFSGETSATLLEGVSLSSLLTGGFAVNSHNVRSPLVYTSCGNIPGIDVTMIASTDGEFSFNIGELVVPAGRQITLDFSNLGERPHTVYFHSFADQNSKNGRADWLNTGESQAQQFVFDRPGLYSFYCPVGSHENSGMIGTLRVVGPSTGGDPTIALEAPTTSRELRGPTVPYGVSVTNFDVSDDDPSSGRIKISLDDTDFGSVDSVIGALTNLAQGVYSLTAELVNSDDSSLNPPVQSTITFTLNDETATPTGNPALGVSPIAGRSTVVIE